MTTDELYMRRCLQLARNGNRYVSPNPMVGSVITAGGRIIGEGYHREYGQPHAEVNAIGSVSEKDLLKEATLYVNLEPCCHWGKTPPCTDLIIRSKIPRVVIGMTDPFSEVAGKGIDKLREAGVNVTVGVLERECLVLNRKFITYHTQKRPYVFLKWAQTIDGYLDNNRPDHIPATWMTGPVCKTWVHRMRSCMDAIITGTRTYRRDNPSLTVRDSGGPDPLRVVPDRQLTLPPELHVFDGQTETLLLTRPEYVESAHVRFPHVHATGIDFDSRSVTAILEALYKRKIQSLFVEGGAELLGSFIREGLWDEAVVFVSPLSVADLAGGTGLPASGTKAPELPGKIISHERLGKCEVFRFDHRECMPVSSFRDRTER